MRAVVDIGSNSVLLLVGTRAPDGRVDVVTDESRLTRLSEGAAKTGRLNAEAIARTVDALREYRDIAERAGVTRITAVATEGLRVASDPESFLVPAREALGCEVEMISGDDEARLSYLSVAGESPAGPLRVIDIGGASTELVVGDGDRIEDQRSHRIGSVRLTERHVTHDPPTAEELAAVEAEAQAAFATQPLPPHPVLHGLAGTVTTAAALVLELSTYDRMRVDGTRLTEQTLIGLRDRLAEVDLEQRIRDPILPRKRADVIVSGLTILIAALRHCGAGTLVVRDRGLRYALI